MDGISDELGLERIVRDNIIEFDISREHLPWQSPDIVPLQTKEDLYTLEELNPLMELIGEASYNVAVQSFKYDPTYTVNFTSVWGNIQRQGNVMHEHSHSNNIFSGVFYINANEKHPPLQIHKPDYGVGFSPTVIEENPINNGAVYYRPSKDSLIIFPSYLRHSVSTNIIEEDRISIAFNIMLRGRFDNPSSNQSVVF